ncbi:MAG: methyltransferase FkbM family protein [Parcubacteria group bacterium GW2011_GWA1_44_13]|uniref:Methyltransferase FkbM family protein n=1 Tax=Candidatus Nomurabacteria bacterium GW2011_GWB1_44_12 TaxID=1618748 RepID=A0A837I877_9BACT|nr:MAG: methyltransferase FkbM family protein [Candidatus Nomurabacteria bacterium GW2011_GWD1_44_10]KKT37077.1 MAG: methyltransferase FkbM family protein [Candidatus Nomurabacteria bacterium GW2011_GWB1_44_12]KKT38373.1 MAG: methyltransferase FkbM family protein [Parcubacteria group bacterium GW2011_GWA1_44_13]KKT60606.1 MAG: hypothetical protein UW54_C0008G0012 [Parcubacteria group bacterium GW2011_GWC1_44_26]
MKIKEIIKKNIPKKYLDPVLGLRRSILKRYTRKISYSQCGEDIIIEFLLRDVLKIKNITYLDLGAHHSSFLSNTYLFYKKGFQGVLIEPDFYLFEEIRKRRQRDIVLNFGVGISNENEADFYVFNYTELNTFSKKTADETKGEATLEGIIKVPLVTVNDILEKYCKICPSFISVDIEGLDLDIVKTLDFKKWRPAALCIETIRHSDRQKIQEITDILIMNNYEVYAETYINTIYVNKDLKISEIR